LKNSDVLIENFKTGTLKKYGLDYAGLKDEFPGLIYCSITGFGQTGPYKDRPAYDMLIQAMGGSMSITGVPDGEPMKMGISMFDLTSGLHAVIGILAALRNKAATGLGQHVDISMLDVAVALLQNQGMNYLAKKQRQTRVGNNHPNVVPYQVMPASDGHFILTASNDNEFLKFCKVAGREDLLEDDTFKTMKARVVNRTVVTPALNEITRARSTAFWLTKLEEAGVGCAPILHLDEVFADPQVQSRGMEIQMPVVDCKKPVALIGSPMKFSRTKVNYRLPPPRLGEHTDQVLLDAGISMEEIFRLREKGQLGDRPALPPVEFEEQLAQLWESDAQGATGSGEGAALADAPGSTWDSVKSMSVPNAAAHIVEEAPKEALPSSKLRGRQIGGATWDSVRSMSVPNAAGHVKDGQDRR
jgi:crotonobetainyl-CoA:carnitine CoA-transferase CaiB-like acyl-CoA transferase